ncbi:hypothetical protein BDW02DRAFT_424260 [Decorospora gaudefroyi]|uniref:Uncharacterized protein n=1 Tax=Decorospora gaudefroyi TaxID=184978 RepID=A0A6A5K6U6_9PLEO|nr:hypothetical protein BDW02DRAFT_424260 [Decorospora gaudefroyi]
MNFTTSSTTQEERIVPKVEDGEELTTMAQPDGNRMCRESSEDSTPIMTLRETRNPAKKASPERRTTRKPNKSTPKKADQHKKGTTARRAKAVLKNDINVKRGVIKEIESYWGKSFIKNYIPKCHRPLVNRGKRGKRSMNRNHETNPEQWLPSVLKAILMIAKLTNNKKWLSKAMNDVVRYRIKNTGNRKPQLVTTDFDVIEDMLVKDWNVEYAFEIRYKHLLVNRQEQQGPDEDIDHIFQTDSDDDEGSDSEEKMNYASGDSDSEDGFDQGQGGVSSNYPGYVKKGSHHISRSLSREKKHGNSKQTATKSKNSMPMHPPPLPYQGPYSYYSPHMPGYGPPMNHWGQPMPSYGSYGDGYDRVGGGSGGGYGGHPGYGVGGSGSSREDRQGSQQPYYGMLNPHHMMNTTPSTPDIARQSQESPKIKRESTDLEEHTGFVEDYDNDVVGQQETGIEDATEEVDAELAELELELKVARLKAKKAMMARK